MTGADVDGLGVNMAAAEAIGTCLWVRVYHVKTFRFLGCIPMMECLI